MGKRYGRQQKRRAREELSRLQSINDKNKEVISEIIANTQYCKSVVEKMSEVFSKYFSMLDPNTIEQCNPSPAFWERVKHNYPIGIHYDESNFVDECMSILRYPCMKLHLEHFQEWGYVRLNYNGKYIGYAVSPEMFHTMPSYIVIRTVAEELTNILYEEMQHGP